MTRRLTCNLDWWHSVQSSRVGPDAVLLRGCGFDFVAHLLVWWILQRDVGGDRAGEWAWKHDAIRNQKTLTWPTNKTRLWARRKERMIWLNKSWITANRHLIQLSADIIRPQLITHSGHPLTIGRPRIVELTFAPVSDALDTGEGAAGRWLAVWWMKSSVRARKYTFSVTGRG